jgi:riboflavin kinase/FMN adenylyltransferase
VIHLRALSSQSWAPGGAAMIGNFDGVHLGHQALLNEVLHLPGPHGVILFEPHPKESFSKEEAPRRIFLLADKLQLLREKGLDYALIIHFNSHIAAWTASHFIQKILHERLALKHLVVGPDFRFGYQRQGGAAEIQAAGIAVHSVELVEDQGEKVSSTLIRNSILQGDFKRAQALLGHAYTVTGRVLHGLKRGRTLGFPTLNIGLRPNMLLSGVYAVRVNGLGDRVLPGVANVGRRPSLNPLVHPLLEVHLFDYNHEVYGRRVRVEFVAKLRDEQKFAALPDLIAQIRHDVEHAKQELICPSPLK